LSGKIVVDCVNCQVSQNSQEVSIQIQEYLMALTLYEPSLFDVCALWRRENLNL